MGGNSLKGLKIFRIAQVLCESHFLQVEYFIVRRPTFILKLKKITKFLETSTFLANYSSKFLFFHTKIITGKRLVKCDAKLQKSKCKNKKW